MKNHASQANARSDIQSGGAGVQESGKLQRLGRCAREAVMVMCKKWCSDILSFNVAMFKIWISAYLLYAFAYKPLSGNYNNEEFWTTMAPGMLLAAFITLLKFREQIGQITSHLIHKHLAKDDNASLRPSFDKHAVAEESKVAQSEDGGG